jgi:hypothetical protein
VKSIHWTPTLTDSGSAPLLFRKKVSGIRRMAVVLVVERKTIFRVDQIFPQSGN